MAAEAETAQDWLELAADFLGEDGTIRLLEPPGADADRLRTDILTERYGKPFILDDGRVRRLHFSLRLMQSAMRLDAPHKLELAYTRLMMAFLLFQPNPKRVLLLGLGGGSLARFCHRQLPRARITAVEINPAVIAMSREFGVIPDELLAVVEADAADYLPQAQADTDVLLLDSFDSEGIPDSLSQPAFYEAMRRRLRPHGVAVANLAGRPESWQAALDGLRDAFEERVLLARVGGDDNQIAFAFAADADFPPPWPLLQKTALGLARRHGLDFLDFLRILKRAATRRLPRA